MADVTKEDVKWFMKQVVLEWDKRNLAKFAPDPSVNSVKFDLDLLESEVAQINTDNFVDIDIFD